MHVGLWLCLTAGCALPPAVESTAALSEGILHTGPTVPESPSLPIRIGVEFLPPAPRVSLLENPHSLLSWPLLGDDARVAPVTVESERTEAARLEWAPTSAESNAVKLPWNLERDELDAIEDPFERASLHFVKELMGEDRRRIRRELGTSILANRHRDLSYPELPNYMGEWNEEYEEVFFSQRGRSLIRRPMRQAMKSFTVFRDLEVALDEFKGDYLPVSGAYQQNHPGRFKFGRISMRVRLTDGSDPLEIAYRRSGFRLGTSQEKFKAGYSAELFEDLTFSLNTRYEYGSSNFAVRADLTYLLDDKTSAHLAAGDELNFLWNSNSYSLVETPMDDSTGLFFYVEHLF